MPVAPGLNKAGGQDLAVLPGQRSGLGNEAPPGQGGDQAAWGEPEHLLEEDDGSDRGSALGVAAAGAPGVEGGERQRVPLRAEAADHLLMRQAAGAYGVRQ